MGNSKNSCVFIFAILLKSWKFDAHEIYMFYSIHTMCVNFNVLLLFISLMFIFEDLQSDTIHTVTQNIKRHGMEECAFGVKI